jgi:hypothetical protein
LIQSEDGLLELEKFEIKFIFEGFEDRNNLLHRKVFRFEVDFE